MQRAFILLDHERRKNPRVTDPREPRDDQIREIPIQFDREGISKPLVTTTAKVIAWLSALLVVVVSLTAWLNSEISRSIVDSRFDKFELRLINDYARKVDLQGYMPRTEYDLRHAELIEKDKQTINRVEDIEKRLRELERDGIKNGR